MRPGEDGTRPHEAGTREGATPERRERRAPGTPDRRRRPNRRSGRDRRRDDRRATDRPERTAVPVLELRYVVNAAGATTTAATAVTTGAATASARAGSGTGADAGSWGSWRVPDPEGLGAEGANRRLEELLPGGLFDPDAVGVPRLESEEADGAPALYRALGFRDAAAEPDDLRSASVLLREIEHLRPDGGSDGGGGDGADGGGGSAGAETPHGAGGRAAAPE